jgi:hypothetical protein
VRAPRRSPDPAVRFRRTLVALVAVLAIVCAALVVVGTSQGPRLDEAQVDTTAVTQDPGQQLRLFVGGQVSHVRASQVTISPSARFSVQTVGTVVAVQFTDRLAYSTTYAVRVRGVTSVDGSHPSTVETRFTTAAATVLGLVRVAGGDDRIVQAQVTAPGRHVVYRAPSIQAFGSVGDDLVVVTERDGLSTVSLVARSDGTTEKLLLPTPGRVTSFAVDPPTGTVVFGFERAGSRPGASTPLLTIPLSGDHRAVPLVGPGRQPVVAASWFLEQGSPVVLASTAGGVVRVDLGPGGTTSRVPRPSEAVAARLDGGSGAALADGSVARFDQAAVSVEAAGSGPSRTLYRAVAGTRIAGVTASPNGQYLAVVTAPDGARSDGATIDPAPVGATTLVVDAATGTVAASLTGSTIIW